MEDCWTFDGEGWDTWSHGLGNQRLLLLLTKLCLVGYYNVNTIKKRKCQYFGHIIRGDGVQRLLMEGRIIVEEDEGDREQCGRITSRNGQKYHIMTVSEWHKIENDGDPWQPTCWLQMAHNDDDNVLLNTQCDWITCTILQSPSSIQ